MNGCEVDMSEQEPVLEQCDYMHLHEKVIEQVQEEMPEEEILKKYLNEFEKLGYAVEHFGGREYAVCAVPANIFGVDVKQLFMEMLGDLEKISGKLTPDIILHRVATMSCKAAIKGKQKITVEEMEQLFDDLMKLENPYNCPHGRPTIISMTKYEIEKKFKRIV